MDKKNLRFAVLATDVIVLALKDNQLLVRLIKTNCKPFFKGLSALPGGLIKPEETAEQSTARLLKEKAGIAPLKVYLEQLFTFSEVERDPRGRVVSVAYLGCVDWNSLTETEKSDNEVAYWCKVKQSGILAYDHNQMLKVALERLKAKISYSTLIVRLLPPAFTLTDLQRAFEIIVGKKLDKRNFRKKISQLNILTESNQQRRGLKARPAKLYNFKSKKVEILQMLS